MRIRVLGWAFSASLFVAAGAAAQAPNPKDMIGKTFKTEELWAHDPVMAYEDGVYYLFTTGMGVNISTSTDLKTWTIKGSCLDKDNLPQWLREKQPFAKGHLWAPDIIKKDGVWHLYYASSAFGKNTSVIGHLTAASLASGEWKDGGMVVQSVPHRDNWNAIDANVIEAGGAYYMDFGSFWGGVKMFRLNDNLSAPAEPQEWFTLSSRPRSFGIDNAGAGDAPVEAPFITRHGEWYYLFVSFDYCCRGAESTYKVVVGRSKSVEGPYVDRDGRPMAQGGGTLVVEGDKKAYSAVGHCAVYEEFPCGPIFLAHGYEMQGGKSTLFIRRIDWSDSWPALKEL